MDDVLRLRSQPERRLCSARDLHRREPEELLTREVVLDEANSPRRQRHQLVRTGLVCGKPLRYRGQLLRCETESRLSDIALDWMLRWAVAIPDGLKFDPRVLSIWPHPEGPQHDEVASGFSFIPKWT